MMNLPLNPREPVEALIRQGNLESLLRKAGELHSHFCPTVQHVQIEVPAYAPIFASVRCAVCGENVMETRARVKDSQPVCIACASAEHGQLDGAGISTASWGVGLTA